MNSSTADNPSYSRMQTWNHCPRKGYYRYALNLQAKDESWQAQLGKVGHAALAARYSGGSVTDAIEDAWEPMLGMPDWATKYHIMNIMERYDAFWNRRGDFEDVLGVELEVGPSRLDMAVRRPDGIWIVDHKWTTGWLANVFGRMELTHQFRVYGMAYEEQYGEAVQGGILNAIYMGDRASTDAFSGSRFEQRDYTFDAGALLETEVWMRSAAEREEAYEGKGEMEHPQNTSLMCKWCDYQPLCAAPPNRRQSLVRVKYKEREYV